MSAATIDRGWRPNARSTSCRGRSHTKPGTLLKSQIPIRTWAQWDDAAPGFVEIDLVGHEGGNALGEHAYTLTVTDIATGWTENRSVRNKARKWVIAALDDIAKSMPFPLLGIDSDNGRSSSIITCSPGATNRKLTFTRSRPGNSNDGAHVEQKNWAIVRTVVGYHRYDTPAELLLLNKIWTLQSLLTNYFQPAAEADQQGPRRREGHQEIRRRDHAASARRRPPRRVRRRPRRSSPTPTRTSTRRPFNDRSKPSPAELLTLTTSKAGPAPKAAVDTDSTRASTDESTNQTTRAS